MNKARRKTISNSLDELQATLPILKEALEHDKMVYDQISDDDDKESQASELEDRIDNIESAISSLEEAIQALEQINL